LLAATTAALAFCGPASACFSVGLTNESDVRIDAKWGGSGCYPDPPCIEQKIYPGETQSYSCTWAARSPEVKVFVAAVDAGEKKNA